MKFIADEGVDAPIVVVLRADGYDVFYIAEGLSGLDDQSILELANSEERVLITQDKDFGELVFRLRQTSSGIILLRLEGTKPVRKAEIVRIAIQTYQDELQRAFTVIQPGLVRIRNLEEEE